MRKNVIALMLVLPLLFVFVVFSAVSTASLGVLIAVTGIEIKGKPAGNTLYINLAKYSLEEAYELDVGVKPANASNQEYDYFVESDGGSAVADIEMVGNKILPHSVGSARITAQSRDGAYRDSISVVVTSSAPYDFGFALYHAATDEGKEHNLITFDREAGSYVAADKDLVTGTYTYGVNVLPEGLASPVIRPVKGYEDAVIVDEAKGTILFPFGGEVAFDVTIPSCVREDNRTKRVKLTVVPSHDAPMLVNGTTQESISVGIINEDSSDWRPRTEIFVQTGEGLTLTEEEISVSPNGTATPSLTELGGGKYRVGVVFEDTAQSVSLILRAVGADGSRETKTVTFDFEIFSFHLSTEGLQEAIADGGSQMLLREQSIIFSVVPEFEVNGMLYLWDVIDHNGAELPPSRYEDMIVLDPTNGGANPEGSRCKVTAIGYNSLILRARAAYLDGNGTLRPYATVEPVRVTVSVTEEVSSIQFNNIYFENGGKEEALDRDHAKNSLGGILTIAHNHYVGRTLEVAESVYEIEVEGIDEKRIDETTGENARVLRLSSYTAHAVDPSDPEKPSALIPDGNLRFVNTYSPTGEIVGVRLRITLPRESNDAGEVLIVVEWAANDSFGRNVSYSLPLNVVNNGIRVSTSPQLFDATENRNSPIVLNADIRLGTDQTGAPITDIEQRKALVHTMPSTYNSQFYQNLGTPEEANVLYVMEFRFDVYGNGYTVNAELFTNSRDTADQPNLFRGPRDLVSVGGIASVAAQDNIAFLCRTDGVTLFNVILLGCDDGTLQEEGSTLSDLAKLNLVGTTLEINADVNVINCRIRNGRNVVRVYGGNRDGAAYFVNDRRTIMGIDDADRILVNIEGCVISQGREFLLKLGANRALQALKDSGLGIDNGVEPTLLNALGETYSNPSSEAPDGNETLLADPEFYRLYVMTDVTLKDSVLERSGLFAVGVESNFSGEALYKSESGSSGLLASWAGTGGTSFSCLLRLSGDVRMYDWKDLKLIDSRTLIQVADGANVGDYDLSSFSLDVAKMLSIVKSDASGQYSDIYLETKDEGGNLINYVHGGIAFYGGGRNYSMLDTSALDESLRDLHRYYINISVLRNDSETSGLAQILPRAAGTQDFRFYMYDASSANSYEKQKADAAAGSSYSGIRQVSPFA